MFLSRRAHSCTWRAGCHLWSHGGFPTPAQPLCAVRPSAVSEDGAAKDVHAQAVLQATFNDVGLTLILAGIEQVLWEEAAF